MKINETRMMVLGVRLVAILIVACAVPAMSAESKPGNGAMPWDSAALVKMPPIHATTERPAKGLRSLFHEGADYKGKPTWVFAYYAAPQGTPPAGGWPAVVCAHGGGGTAYPGWVRNWNSHGYAAIAMDLEGHLPGGKDHGMEGNLPLGASHENAEPARVDWFGDRALPDNEQWFYHAVADVIRANSLLCSFPEINPKKIGLTGISWGGGQFGVYRKAPAADRNRCIEDTRKAMEKYDIGWCMWDYAGDFGVATGKPGQRVADVNTLKALGLTTPPAGRKQ